MQTAAGVKAVVFRDAVKVYTLLQWQCDVSDPTEMADGSTLNDLKAIL